MAGEEDYVLRAKGQLRDLLNTERALIKNEAIARLGEQYYADDNRNLDSPVVGLALQELQTAARPSLLGRSVRGGHRIDTIQPADQKLRQQTIDAAARRKRAL